MKRILLFCLPLLLCGHLPAQEQLTTAYFPVAGDTLRTFFADSTWAAGLDVQLAGGNDLTWEFLEPVGIVPLFSPVSVADDGVFPNAEIVINTPSLNRNYFRVNNNTLELVGTSTRLDILPDFGFDAAVDPAVPERRTGVATGDAFTSGFTNTTTVSPDSIPPEALALLPAGALALVDSIRFSVTTTSEEVFDADGTVQLGDNFYSVIRERRAQSAFVKVEVRLPLVGYRDIAGLLGDDPNGIGDLLGQQDTVVTYYWWNNESKEPIARVETTPTGEFIGMRYKRALESTSTDGPRANQAEIMLYPNPVSDYFTYKVEGISAGRYQLSVVNILGREMLNRRFTALGDQTKLTVDAAHLPSGTYVASLRNERGLIISSLRVLVR